MASIISLIGPLPADLLKRGRHSSRYFYDDGNISIIICHHQKVCLANSQTGQFRFPELISEGRGFENKLTGVEGEEREMFLCFISKLLRWQPEDRATAKELLSDPWLNASF